jgi:uncharacterized protein (DUF983 family)
MAAFALGAPRPNQQSRTMIERSAGRMTHVLRGFRQRCPNCGAGGLFRRYLKPAASCAACGESYGHIRADDFPPYLTILLVGHLVVPFILLAEQRGVSAWVQVAVWPALALALTLLLLPRCKGAIIGLMWSLGLAGGERQ